MRSKALVLACLAALMGCAQPAHRGSASFGPDPEDTVSPYAANLLSVLKDTDVADFVETWPVVTTLPKDLAHYEWVDIPTLGDVVSDGYRFALLVDHVAGNFWVWESGGIAGVTQFRGPAVLTDDNQVRPVPSG